MDDLKLGAGFPAAAREDWRKLVEAVLKGAEFDKKLVSRTYDGLRIEPLYPKSENAALVPRATSGRWRISQRVDHPDSVSANELALADLEGGSDALALVLAGAPTARGFGVPVEDLERALDWVRLDWIILRLEAAPSAGPSPAIELAAIARRRGIEPCDMGVDCGLDPLGDFARSGRLPSSWTDVASDLAMAAGQIRDVGLAGTALRVDTRPYHEAGASEAQELAAALASAVAYLRALETGGYPLELARNTLSFLLVADADEFLTVAKFRALRRLWTEVEKACGLAPKPILLQAETAWRMATRRDPWVNLLRTTVAVFSAGLGGADLITVLPFTAALGLPDTFARRMARNTQLILLEEANLSRVADPAAGAGGFEALTEALSEKAWALFQEIEREGGMPASIASGAFQARIASVRAERERNITRRKDPLTGVSEFPDLHEAPVSVLMPSPTNGAALPHDDDRALPSMRASEPFERLRDASDEMLAANGARPRVFLANLGPVSAFTARATFAKNLFEAGGFEIIRNEGFGSQDEMAAAFNASGAPLACLCSSDEIYASQGAKAAEALKAAGARFVYLAGRPGEQQEPLSQAGVDDYIFAGSDVLHALQEAHRRTRNHA